MTEQPRTSALDEANSLSSIITKLQSAPPSEAISKDQQDQLVARYIDKLGKTIVPGADESSFGNTLLRMLVGPKTSEALFGPTARSVGQSYMMKGVEQEREALSTQKANLLEAQSLVGGPQQKDLSPMGRALIEKLGGIQTKDESFPMEAAGPTRPVFGNPQSESGTGQFDQDQWGGTEVSAVQMNPDVREQIIGGGASGRGILDQLMEPGAGPDERRSPEFDKLMRDIDPGLQAEGVRQVEDPEAEVPESLMRQAGLGLKTELSSTRAAPDRVPVEQTREAMAQVLRANNIPEEEILARVSAVTSDMPPSVVNQMLQGVGSASQANMNEAGRNQRAIDFKKGQMDRLKLSGELQSGLLDKKSALSQKNNLTLRHLSFEHAKALQEGRIDARVKQSEEQDARRFENQLSLLKNKQGFSKEENELNRIASYGEQVLRGEQQLDLEGARQLNRVALANKKVGSTNLDTVKKFYTDFMKANPAVAGQLLDIISSGESGSDPFTDEGIREALADRFKEIVGGQVVMERMKGVVYTDIFGNTQAEKMSALHLSATELMAGDPENGVPAMTPEQVQPIFDQIAAMERFAKAGAQTTNIKIGADEKPMTTQEAARFAAMSQSFKELNRVKQLLFNRDGSINRKNILTSFNFSNDFFSLDGLPFSEGREMLQALKNATEQRLRAETGAAAPDSEVVRMAQRFIPNSLDSDESIRIKIERMDEFVQEAISLVDPTGVQRGRGSKSTPVQELKGQGKERNVNSRGDELKARGLSDAQVLDQLEKEGY